ncbi:MAG: Septum formation protein Maf [Elusimicrobia bacterium ADurb.Bin231]|nr:MAG: Septum formation protein Maf [Elusimicrobia bacterium ADurb.Bin231]
MKKKIKIILASSSPQRKKILKKAGFDFSVIRHGINEDIIKNISPSKLVRILAMRKAVSVYDKIKSSPFAKSDSVRLILGADTIVVADGEIIGKPADRLHAAEILKKLSGSKHYVYTGLAFVDLDTGKKISGYEKTVIHFKKLSDKDISNLSKKNHDKAGAYAIQSEGDLFVKKIDGDYLNVVGFPLSKFRNMLKKF